MISATALRNLGLAIAATMILHANVARAERQRRQRRRPAIEVDIDNFTFEPAELT